MSHFKNATSEFKKRLADQPLIKRAVVQPLSSQDDGPVYTGSNANPNNNGLQVFSSSKKKKTEGTIQITSTSLLRHSLACFAVANFTLKLQRSTTSPFIFCSLFLTFSSILTAAGYRCRKAHQQFAPQCDQLPKDCGRPSNGGGPSPQGRCGSRCQA